MKESCGPPIAQDIAMPLSALLHTTDLAATRDFYGSVLGFTVTDSAEGTLTDRKSTRLNSSH